MTLIEIRNVQKIKKDGNSSRIPR